MPMHRTLNMCPLLRSRGDYFQRLLEPSVLYIRCDFNSRVHPASDICTGTFGSLCVTDLQLTVFTSILAVRLRGLLAYTYCNLS
jgi:hypothetical protein